jgi:AcrR family transcriptional regulator
VTTPSSSGTTPESDTTAKILDAAQRLFLQDGYAGVNLDRIAKAAGVARQTLYNRFGSKESVFRAMVQRHWSKLQTGHIDDLTESSPYSADAVLRRFAEAILRFVDETDQVGFIRLVIAESRRLPWIAEEFYRAGKEPLMKALVGQLDELQANGLIDCRSTELAAHQFFGLLQEVTLWPQVMGVGELVADPPAAVVIDESVATFMARYSPITA